MFRDAVEGDVMGALSDIAAALATGVRFSL